VFYHKPKHMAIFPGVCLKETLEALDCLITEINANIEIKTDQKFSCGKNFKLCTTSLRKDSEPSYLRTYTQNIITVVTLLLLKNSFVLL
jgi:hypothetical protein